jgi:hypothetical protein
MKFLRPLFSICLLVSLCSCGKPDTEGERCRSAEEAIMKCQVDYAEKFKAIVIPDYIKDQCISYHPTPGCYLDSSKRYYW